MLKMKEGGVVDIFMPPDLAYGEKWASDSISLFNQFLFMLNSNMYLFYTIYFFQRGVPGIIPPGAALIYRLYILEVHIDKTEAVENDPKDTNDTYLSEEL